MALAININDLLNKQKIESNRIEFKKGWNPGSIYHSICAFANDFDDLGGGYIIVGVDTDDKTGMAIRPVEGVPIEKIDGTLQEMVAYNNKMAPYYLPRTSVEEYAEKPSLPKPKVRRFLKRTRPYRRSLNRCSNNSSETGRKRVATRHL